MALNIITATFCNNKKSTWTEEQWQWDYGQILQFEGLELPEAYEVHFSNIAIGGESVTQIGNADGVTIPDQFFVSGETIYAWVYLHQGDDDGETVYSVTIPVKKRPQPSDDVPTPVEQSAIDQAIAALNIAVEKADEAITHYPQIIDGTWHVWDVTEEEYVDTGVQAQGQDGQPGRDGTDGQDGQDGFSPVITVTDITGGHRVTITTATGTQTVDVLNGQPGTPGTDGTDGYSPTVTVTEITGGHRVVITDKNGSHTFDVMDGSDATVTVDDELSPTSTNPVQNKVIDAEIGDLKAEINQLSESIAPVETSTTATAAHAVGELFLVGETLMVALSAIAVGDTITTEGGSPNAAVTTLSSKLLKDVQVDGTSVVNQGVANVPLATGAVPGVVSVSSTFGLQMNPNLPDMLMTQPASLTNIKNGDAGEEYNQRNYRVITPAIQHNSIFYGLARAASDTTQSQSSNPVGTYTNSAKNAICNMIGVNRKMRLLKTYTVSSSLTSFGFDTDKDGLPFAVDAITVIACIPQTSASRTISYAIEEILTNNTSSRWVSQFVNITGTNTDVFIISEIVRDEISWKTKHMAATSQQSGVYTGGVNAKGSSVGFSMNGASWIRANNPLYATKLAVSINGEDIPIGAYFEFYAHDYQG